MRLTTDAYTVINRLRRPTFQNDGKKGNRFYNNAAIAARAIRILDKLDANIVVLDHNEVIIATNEAWRKFAANNRASHDLFPRNIDEGVNHLDIF